MATLYEELQADAVELLQELGQPVVYHRYQVLTDLVEGTADRTLTHSQELPTMVLPVKDGATAFESLDMKPIQGTEALTEVKFAIIGTEGATFVPARGDEAMFGSKTWVVLSSVALNLDGQTDVAYMAGLQQL